MPNSETIDNQQKLLAANRRTLAILLQQRAIHGGALTPPSIIAGIEEARAGIQDCKTALRTWGVTVEDEPNDSDSTISPTISPIIMRRSSDIYSNYLLGIEQLIALLGTQHPNITEAMIYHQRLTESIARSRRYGDTETRRAERSEILDQINELTITTLNITFQDLCK